MDQDALELARHCCRAGMIMEDVSTTAIMSPREGARLRPTVAELVSAVERMRVLLQAAESLIA